MPEPPVLLLAFANYYEKETSYLRNLPEERKQIVAALSRAKEAGLCEPAVLYEATADEVIEAFRKYKGRIALFHFAGHANAYSLHLEDPFRKKDSLFMNGFAEFLGAQHNLQAVFLNGCSTANQSRMLVRQSVPAVISTHSDVSDTVAQQLARHFYEGLGAGSSIGDAFGEAVGIVKSQAAFQDGRALWRGIAARGLPWNIDYAAGKKQAAASWNLPEIARQPLYSLPPLREMPLPANPFPGLRPYTAAERPVFWGRDYDIRRLCRAATAPSAPQVLILYGGRGVGKTSFLQAGLLPYLEQEHAVARWEWTKDGKAPAMPESREGQYAFLVLDAPPAVAREAVVKQLQPLLAEHPERRALICLPTGEANDWEKGFEQEKITFRAYYLPPLRLSEIQQVAVGGFKNRLEKDYGATVDSELPERLAHLLSKDGGSCIAPLLQHSMERLWAEARKEKREQPALAWAAFRQLMQDGLWMAFIEQQLGDLSPAHYESGLWLNLLSECLPETGNPKPATVASIAEKYGTELPVMNGLLQQLLAARLLCSPAPDTFVHGETVRLSHQLLERPLLHLLNRSQRPGQEIPRLFRHHLKRGSFLSQAELDQVRSGRHAAPSPAPEEQRLIDESSGRIRAENRQRRRRRAWSSAAVVLILLLGYLFADPYLLLYSLLLYFAYQGALTLKSKT
ncbi:MAG: CHAT domain-containing protein [Phaeodactylibacter sp.]|nr:CHAT domain-containing protein [Phaeodactylibacter sp.]